MEQRSRRGSVRAHPTDWRGGEQANVGRTTCSRLQCSSSSQTAWRKRGGSGQAGGSGQVDSNGQVTVR